MFSSDFFSLVKYWQKRTSTMVIKNIKSPQKLFTIFQKKLVMDGNIKTNLIFLSNVCMSLSSKFPPPYIFLWVH